MDLKQLEYFTTIVNEGTISAAAKKLNLSQPPLSAQMKALEQEFGCVLFERGSRKIQLTEAGRILFRHAANLLELSNRASVLKFKDFFRVNRFFHYVFTST